MDATQHREHRIVDQAIAGQDLAPEQIDRAAAPVGQLTAGFFANQRAGSDVPGLQLQFPLAVEPASRHQRQVDRRRTQATNAARPLLERHKLRQVVQR